MPTALSLNHEANTYLAVTLSTASPFFIQPAALAAVHPSVAHVGQVGQLQDIQLFSVPKFEWEHASAEVLSSLKKADGVGRIDIQGPQQRIKRDGGEL